MQSTQIIVRFFDESLKDNYKRRDAKRHSWRSVHYLVLAIESYSESSIGHFLLCNDEGECWFVDTRDVRVINTDDFCDDGKN